MRWSINVQWGTDSRTVLTGIKEAELTCRRVRACSFKDLVGPRPLKFLQDAAIKRLMVAAKRVRDARREFARTGRDWRVELIKLAKTEYRSVRPTGWECHSGAALERPDSRSWRCCLRP